MKTEKKSPWGATLFVVAGIACVAGGAFTREKLQHGSIDWQNSVSHEALLASKDDSPPVSESTNFRDLVDKLHTYYVEPFGDDMKLATGAVKGMVGSLEDPLASFMSKDQFRTFVATQAGVFEGAGVEVTFQYSDHAKARFDKDSATKKAKEGDKKPATPAPAEDFADFVPDVVVTAVVPGGPADKAGIKPGDVIDVVNGKWVLSSKRIKQLREENKAIRESKISDSEMDKKLRDLNERAKGGTTPAKARDALSLGTSGELKLTLGRGDATFQVTVTKAKTTWPAVAKQPDGSLAVRLFTGVEDQLSSALKGTTTAILDLRNSTQGNFDVLTKVLDRLAPVGTYGTLAKSDGTLVSELKSAGPGSSTTSLTLLVDKTTRGAAEILALALSSKNIAQLQGDPKMAGERAIIRSSLLPDGSGYTIPIARYSPASAVAGVKK